MSEIVGKKQNVRSHSAALQEKKFEKSAACSFQSYDSQLAIYIDTKT